MSRGIFDPNSGETERSGNQFVPAEAEQASNLPLADEDEEVSEESEDSIETSDADVAPEVDTDNPLQALAAAEQEVESEHAAERKEKFTKRGEQMRP